MSWYVYIYLETSIAKLNPIYCPSLIGLSKCFFSESQTSTTAVVVGWWWLFRWFSPHYFTGNWWVVQYFQIRVDTRIINVLYWILYKTLQLTAVIVIVRGGVGPSIRGGRHLTF